ncbi:MAG: cytochrome c biogenesis protein CcdA [Bacteroidota bacterium]
MNPDFVIKRVVVIWMLSLIGSFGALAQILEPASWTHEIKEAEVKAGDETELHFNVTIDDNWYVYSTDFDPDLGPMITEFTFEENDSYELIGGIEPQNPSRKYDSLWEGEISYFKKQGTFAQRIKVLKDDYRITGGFAYQVCSDIDGKCILFEEEFEFAGVSQVKQGGVTSPDASVTDGPKRSLWSLFIISFLAGVAAMLMPCIYPLIPVTISIFLKQSNNRSEGIKKASIYGLSIIIMFSVIGFLVSLIWGLSSLNALSTNWIFNLLIFGLLVVFALSFLGLFEINLPNSLVNKIDRQADRGGYLGIFFMAATLVVVSFSCTVPIVGTAIFTLIDGDVLRGTLSMFAFSLAFAIPFTFFAFFPSYLNSLPKSGGWMNTLKVVLGFLELALALKFLSVADLAYHWGILDREVFIALWIVIFAFLGFYLLGKIRLPKDEKIERIPISNLMSSLVVFSFVIYLIPGLFGAPLKSLAGFLPPMTTHDFNIVEVIQGQRGGAITYAAEETLCEQPKYADLLELPLGLRGYFDYEQALACAAEQNKPIFIDFTGHGCVNCREMEQRVWSDPGVLQRLHNDFVVLALYVDDKTKLPEEEWVLSSYDNKWKKAIGKKNADFQITRFENNAQPFYVILNEKGDLIAGPKAYDLNIANFIAFLEGGKQAYANRTLVTDLTY